MIEVHGTTTVVGLFGYPVRHSCSPEMQNAAFAELGLDWVYVCFEVAPEDLPRAVASIRALGLAGVNVTIPHKRAAAGLVDEVDEAAVALDAVNTIVNRDGRLLGYNTDAPGFIRSLEEADATVEGKRVVVFGGGGGARGVAYAVARAGASSLTILNRTPSKAAAVAALVNRAVDGYLCVWRPLADEANRGVVEAADVLIDTTDVGMHPHVDADPIVPEAWIQPGQVVVDITYHPPDTVLLRAARRRGARVVDGLGMLVHQGAIAQSLWTGRPAPAATMRRALEAALRARRRPCNEP
jgi:shikimate dehydrogenase